MLLRACLSGRMGSELSMADGNITVEVSTQDDQMRLLHLHRENARLRRRIMADAVTSDAAAATVANLAQSLADARAEIDRLRAVLGKIEAGEYLHLPTMVRDALGPNVKVTGAPRSGDSG